MIELLFDEVVQQGKAIACSLLNLIQAVFFGVINVICQRLQIVDTHHDVLDFGLFFDAIDFHLLHRTPDLVLALIEEREYLFIAGLRVVDNSFGNRCSALRGGFLEVFYRFQRLYLCPAVRIEHHGIQA